TAGGGTGTYTYLWSNAATTSTITGLTAGTYDVTVYDGNMCEAYSSVTISENTVVTASTTVDDDVTCNGGSDGAATVTAGGGDGTYTYLWSNAATTATITGLTAGTYDVTVYDGNMCEAYASVTISENIVVTASTTVDDDVTCNGGSDGAATVTAGGGAGTYTYLWSNTATTSTITGLTAGTYDVTVYDGNMCEAYSSVTISENSAVTANIVSSSDVTCNGDCDGSATALGNGGDGSYIYDWSNGETTASISGLCAGTYSVTVYDGNLCSAETSVTINENPTVTASISAFNDATIAGVCDGDATVLAGGGDGTYTYLWSDAQNTATATGLCAGSYTVTVYDGNGCSATANVVIDEPVALTLSIVGTDVTCYGDCDGLATVTPTGGVGPYTYTWSDGQSTQTAINLCAGTYQVTVEDTNGAQETASITINENTAVSVSVVSTVDVTCNGDCDGEATINPSGGTASFSQIWDDGQASLTAINLCAGIHSVTVTDGNSCTAETTVTINENPAVNASIASSTDVSCNGDSDGSATVTPGGGNGSYTYLWSDGQTTATANNLSAGSYDVTVYDGNMCEAYSNVTISENPVVTASISSSSDVTCNGGSDGSATVTPGGGDGSYTYLWSDGQTTSTANNLSAGTYFVTVYDGNMCEATTSITISENSAVIASISSSSDVTCNGGSDGSAIVTPGGGDGSYTYLWSDGQTTATAISLSAGSYDVTVYDGNMCEAYASVTISENPAVTASTTVDADVTCNGGSDGSAIVTPGGGDGSYTYLWSDGQTSAIANNLSAGSYDVTVYDGNMCEAYSNVTISENSAVTANIASSSDVTCNGGSDGSATVTPGGGNGSYTYLWSDGQTTATANNLFAGSYDVTVYDGNMCEAYSGVTISENPVVTASISSSSDVTCNGGSDGSATVTPGGGTGSYTYLWSNSQTIATANSLSANTYTVTVYDGNMCEAITSVVIDENPAVVASITNSSDVLCYGDCNGSAVVSASGGDNNFIYAWNDPMNQTTATANALCPGNYSVQVTDGLGCTDVVNVTIDQPSQMSLTVYDVENVTCYGSGDGSITVGASGGIGSSYSYSWVGSTSTLPVLPNVAGGTYIVTAEDQNGCTVSETITVQEPDELVINENPTNVQCGMTPGSCNVSVTGGNGGYIYSWDGYPTVTGSTLSGLGQGTYTVNVQDALGCSSQATMVINTMGSLSVTINEDIPITCFGESNAALSAQCNNGAQPFEYFWNPVGSTNDRIENLSSGIYNVQITDDWGCVGSNSFHIIEPNPIVPSFDVNTIACFNGTDGQVIVNAAGGTAPYAYIWDGVGSNDTITDLQSGWYHVLVQDAHNCSINDSVFVGQPESPLQMMLHKENITCYGDNNGSIRALAHGGTAPYVYEWLAEDEISNDTAIFNLPEGFYSLIITDANACVTDTMVAIQEPAPLMVDYMSTNPSCIGNNDGYIELEVVGGTEPYVYIWDMATASLPYFDGLYEGSYEIIVQDDNGCELDLETITLMDVPEECLRIPDAFTPNGDNNNDTWIIENLDLFNNYYVQVFNRWGQALYTGQPGSEPWDGTTTEGKSVPTGSYVYIVNLFNGSDPKTGIVTVVY
ncbi:MAG: gliding motility-associated C-terminal domain-containing protein, partial [Bacteroidota bacterium]|nr:gliding motility-associated C-terminal domain-containing protein [Bacteroidota bacterium]